MKTKAERVWGGHRALSNSRKAVQLVLKLRPVEILTSINTTSGQLVGVRILLRSTNFSGTYIFTKIKATAKAGQRPCKMKGGLHCKQQKPRIIFEV